MSSSRMEQVFYNTHSKVSHYVLRHTSHRLRSVIEHAALGLAVAGFCVVILSHRTFVHREDIASLSHEDGIVASCNANNTGGYGVLGFIGEGQGVSMYSIVVHLIRSVYAWMVLSKQPLSSKVPLSLGKKIPVSCLKKIPGFREDADVNHILLQYDNSHDGDEGLNNQIMMPYGSRAFTTHRGRHEHEQIVSGATISTNQSNSCFIGASPELARQRSSLFGFPKDQMQSHEECSHEITYFLARHGYHLPIQSNETLELQQKKTPTATHQQYSPIVYSYSHSQGLLRLQPSLQHAHNISTQFIIASSSDPNCFGEPFAQSIIFRLVGPDTVILNWILGLQHAIARPRFVYHWKTKKELDLDVFDMDHYAFSSKSSGDRSSGAYETIIQSTSTQLPFFASINNIIAKVQKYPMYRFLRFLTFKLLVLLSTLLIFFLTTSLVSFTFQETQDRMVEFTLQLQTRVRARMPYGGLILGHVLENLVFVPIMVGMIFFLIEFYGDKFLAFMVLSMVWVCEVFSAVSIRSAQGMHFFPRVFFLYFTLFHVYFFSCPIGFTYASLASTILFLFHTMLFFLNRYELPALHAGLITAQSPRMARLEMNRGRVGGEANGAIPTPPRIQPVGVRNIQHLHPPSMPLASSLDDRSSVTAPTAPLSSTIDFTPESDQQTLLSPSYSGPMRSYVAAASTSLQSMRSLASIQSLSLASVAAGRTSPNFIFQGGYSFNDSGGVGDDSEEDSYIARVTSY
mmetsp:Transcript_22084/g.48024  ORF Transcript_22084/g.48024 Transcript_22084/m.48024 type:complete len:741 (-) Transcript_22084:255-2477(-)